MLATYSATSCVAHSSKRCVMEQTLACHLLWCTCNYRSQPTQAVMEARESSEETGAACVDVDTVADSPNRDLVRCHTAAFLVLVSCASYVQRAVTGKGEVWFGVFCPPAQCQFHCRRGPREDEDWQAGADSSRRKTFWPRTTFLVLRYCCLGSVPPWSREGVWFKTVDLHPRANNAAWLRCEHLQKK